MKILSFVVLVASLLGTVPPASAVRLNHLFEARVDATGRDAAARDAALAAALEEVLVRLTGSRAELQGTAAAGLLKTPGRFAEQYRYSELPSVDDGPRQLQLWVQFDGVSLARELRQGGMPYWGAERPDILVWLAVDDRGRRYLLSEAGEQEVASMFRKAAGRRGLPVTLPLLDLEDQRAVDFTDVWGGFLGRVETASQRYRPQVILTGRLDRGGSAGGWRGDWQLLDQDNRQSWRSHGATLDAAVDVALSEAAGWLAQHYAVVATRAGMRTLVVDGVRDLDDYARVSAYLGSLSPVDRIDVLRVSGQEVEFNLALSADERNLLQLITLGRLLQPDADPIAWRFHLNP